MNTGERSEVAAPPNDVFTVGIAGDPQQFLALINGLSRVDLARDKRFSNRNLSNTTFYQNPIFREESTSIDSSKQEGNSEPRFSLQTILSLSDVYLGQESQGYFSLEKMHQIVRLINQQVPNSILREFVTSHSTFDIIGINERAGVHVDLGHPSAAARETASADVNLLDSDDFFDHVARIAGSPTDEQRRLVDAMRISFKNTMHEALDFLSPVIPINPEKGNTSIHMQLYGIDAYKNGTAEEMLAGLQGVSLTSLEALRKALEFYTLCYQVTVNTICKLEGVNPPKPGVLIGSSLPK